MLAALKARLGLCEPLTQPQQRRVQTHAQPAAGVQRQCHAAACRATLAPLAADAARSDEAIRNDYPPSDADAYLSVLKATRTNLKLCR